MSIFTSAGIRTWLRAPRTCPICSLAVLVHLRRDAYFLRLRTCSKSPQLIMHNNHVRNEAEAAPFTEEQSYFRWGKGKRSWDLVRWTRFCRSAPPVIRPHCQGTDLVDLSPRWALNYGTAAGGTGSIDRPFFLARRIFLATPRCFFFSVIIVRSSF